MAAIALDLSVARTARGRFQPGVSGNPAGKQPGTLNRATELKRQMAAGQPEAAIRLLVDRALQDEWPALRMLFERLEPKPRQASVALAISETASRLEIVEAITRATFGGEIATDEAFRLLRLLDRREQERALAGAANGRADGEGATAPDDVLHSSCNSETDSDQASLPRRAAMGEGRVGATAPSDAPAPRPLNRKARRALAARVRHAGGRATQVLRHEAAPDLHSACIPAV
jgi:Family of unknown function (DUF5681)